MTFPSPVLDQSLPIASEIAQLADHRGRDETAAQQPDLEKLRDPSRVGNVGLAARDHPHVPLVDQQQLLGAVFEHEPHGLPRDPSRFHRNVIDAFTDEPVAQQFKIADLRRELSGLGPTRPVIARRAGTHHHHLLVHIESRDPIVAPSSSPLFRTVLPTRGPGKKRKLGLVLEATHQGVQRAPRRHAYTQARSTKLERRRRTTPAFSSPRAPARHGTLTQDSGQSPARELLRRDHATVPGELVERSGSNDSGVSVYLDRMMGLYVRRRIRSGHG